jgi:CrcB protein
MSYLLVMLGGALGAGGRFLVGKLTLGWFGPGYPWGTLSVNLLGGFLMGMLVGTLTKSAGSQENARLFLAIGVLGGFTTFSSFALDAVNMIDRGGWVNALGYVLISVIGSILAVFAGLGIVRAIA